MSDLPLEERPKHAILADIHEETIYLTWNEITWHRPSRWRGLMRGISAAPSEGIPDEQRVARTLCGEFVPLPFMQSHDDLTGADVKRCSVCETERRRMERVSQR